MLLAGLFNLFSNSFGYPKPMILLIYKVSCTIFLPKMFLSKDLEINAMNACYSHKQVHSVGPEVYGICACTFF